MEEGNYMLVHGETFVVAHFRHDLENAIEGIEADSEQSIRTIGIIGTIGGNRHNRGRSPE
jgi:hypothetical protein